MTPCGGGRPGGRVLPRRQTQSRAVHARAALRPTPSARFTAAAAALSRFPCPPPSYPPTPTAAAPPSTSTCKPSGRCWARPPSHAGGTRRPARRRREPLTARANDGRVSVLCATGGGGGTPCGGAPPTVAAAGHAPRAPLPLTLSCADSPVGRRRSAVGTSNCDGVTGDARRRRAEALPGVSPHAVAAACVVSTGAPRGDAHPRPAAAVATLVGGLGCRAPRARADGGHVFLVRAVLGAGGAREWRGGDSGVPWSRVVGLASTQLRPPAQVHCATQPLRRVRYRLEEKATGREHTNQIDDQTKFRFSVSRV